MENSSKRLVEICKEAVSEIVGNGFLKRSLSSEQLERLKEIKESHKK